MLKMTKLVTKLARCEEGATGIEYALILSLITMAIIGEVTTLGNSVGDNFDAIHDGVEFANSVS